MGMVVERFDVFLVRLDPVEGSEIKKTRPCAIISPTEMNSSISTVIVAPMTSKGQAYPTRVECEFKGKTGQIVLDQIRTVDKRRLLRKMGVLAEPVQQDVLKALSRMFAE